MEMDDWALPCDWPLSGDQWQCSVDPFFEPLELIATKPDVADCQPLCDNVTQKNQFFNSSWSDVSSRMCVTVYH